MKKYFHKLPFYITMACIFVPIIQMILGYNLNRHILVLSSCLFLFSLKIPKLRTETLFIIISIFGFILYGILKNRGFAYSANSAPLIFGLIFFIYFKSRIIPSEIFYAGFVSRIYKILLLFMVVEFVIANYDPWILDNVFHAGGYIVFGSKLSIFIGFPLWGNNSLYLGPQIYSMVAVSGIMWFFPYNRSKYNYNNIKWFYLSLLLFILGFSFTSIVMFLTWLLLTFLYFLEARKRLLNLSFPMILFSLIISIIFFSANPQAEIIQAMRPELVIKSRFDQYIFVFTEIIIAFMKLPLNYQFFGIPSVGSITDYTWSFEFGYFIRLMKLGLLFNLFIIGLNVLALINVFIHKNKHTQMTKVNLIILTMWHLSMIHYMPAAKTGPAQLFGLHIALFLFFSHFTIKNNSLNRSFFRLKNKIIPQV